MRQESTAADRGQPAASTPSPLAAFRARLGAEPDIPAIAQAIEETARAHAGADAARVWLAAAFAAAYPATPVLAADDATVALFTRRSEPVAPAELPPDARLRDALLASGVALVAPLVARGVLVGLLALGSSSGGFAEPARQAVGDLAAYAALAILAARLAARQDVASAQASDAEEWRIAREIQRGLLPKELPALPGWEIRAHYQPARVLGGDLYDFIELPGGLLGIVFGDASDKSVPAALMMAAVRTLLRAAAQRIVLPGQVLARVNDALCAQNPPGNFVTCFYGILDPGSGRLRFANAGQTPPYARTADGARELRARGWPLGMMPDRTYEEQDAVVAPGETVLFYSDGLVETHAPDGAMLGEERLAALVAASPQGALLDAVLAAQQRFAGASWEQEDDLTLVTVGRAAPADPPHAPTHAPEATNR